MLYTKDCRRADQRHLKKKGLSGTIDTAEEKCGSEGLFYRLKRNRGETMSGWINRSHHAYQNAWFGQTGR